MAEFNGGRLLELQQSLRKAKKLAEDERLEQFLRRVSRTSLTSCWEKTNREDTVLDSDAFAPPPISPHTSIFATARPEAVEQLKILGQQHALHTPPKRHPPPTLALSAVSDDTHTVDSENDSCFHNNNASGLLGLGRLFLGSSPSLLRRIDSDIAAVTSDEKEVEFPFNVRADESRQEDSTDTEQVMEHGACYHVWTSVLAVWLFALLVLPAVWLRLPLETSNPVEDSTIIPLEPHAHFSEDNTIVPEACGGQNLSDASVKVPQCDKHNRQEAALAGIHCCPDHRVGEKETILDGSSCDLLSTSPHDTVGDAARLATILRHLESLENDSTPKLLVPRHHSWRRTGGALLGAVHNFRRRAGRAAATTAQQEYE